MEQTSHPFHQQVPANEPQATSWLRQGLRRAETARLVQRFRLEGFEVEAHDCALQTTKRLPSTHDDAPTPLTTTEREHNRKKE